MIDLIIFVILILKTRLYLFGFQPLVKYLNINFELNICDHKVEYKVIIWST